MTRSPGDPAVRRFLRRSMVARIATLSPAGNPDIIPLWFAAYRGRLYMGTRSANPTVRDLLRDPEVTLLFHGEHGRATGRVLRIRGRAHFRTGRRQLAPVFIFFVLRYLLVPGGIWNLAVNRRKLAIRARYMSERSGDGGMIEVVPETAEFIRVLSAEG
jgi:uncharacterized pyridoxamine 5'-phosphate oxidase family protein